jgi:hypothetical protein
MTPKERREAMAWANKQTTQVNLDIPVRMPDEEPATKKQKDYIRSLVLEIDEQQVNSLGKWQASALIDQIKIQKEIFTDEKAQEYLSTRRSGCLVMLFPFAAAVMYFLAK